MRSEEKDRSEEAAMTMPGQNPAAGLFDAVQSGGLISDVVRTPCAVDPWALYRLLEQGRFNLTTETATQYDIWRVLTATYAPSLISREHKLSPRDRPDFLIDGRIVVEVKGDRHRAPSVVRQLERYAEHAEVEAIILATSRAMVMPAAIQGKPCRVLTLGAAWL